MVFRINQAHATSLLRRPKRLHWVNAVTLAKAERTAGISVTLTRADRPLFGQEQSFSSRQANDRYPPVADVRRDNRFRQNGHSANVSLGPTRV